jgi:putative heme transporter
MVDSAAVPDRRSQRLRLLRRVGIVAVLVLFTVELVLGWSSLVEAFAQFRAPRPGLLVAAIAVELAAMGAYARMQRHLLRSAGVRVSLREHMALAYAAHSLSVTLPGGPAFSTRFNYQQMQRFGATPAVATWCIALSGLLSATALAVVTAVGALTAGGGVHWGSLVGLVVVIVLIAVAVRHLARHPETGERLTRRVLGGLNRLRRRPSLDGLERALRFETQLGAARLTALHGGAAVAYALLNWVADAACFWISIRAVTDAAVSPAQVLLAYCAGMAAGSITLIPGGLGIIDSALVLGLVAADVAAPTAIAAVVLYRLISFGLIIGTGWVVWLFLRRRGAP